jgi:hypothetical protein
MSVLAARIISRCRLLAVNAFSALLQCIAANGLTFGKLWVYGWTKEYKDQGWLTASMRQDR